MHVFGPLLHVERDLWLNSRKRPPPISKATKYLHIVVVAYMRLDCKGLRRVLCMYD